MAHVIIPAFETEAGESGKVGGHPGPQSKTLTQQNNKKKGVGDAGQLGEFLPSMQKSPNSVLSVVSRRGAHTYNPTTGEVETG